MEEVFKWEDYYSVGNETLDAQHKALIAVLNKLEHNIEKSESRNDGEFHILLNDAFEYARQHFDLEEKLFKNSAYPGVKEHVANHMSFINEVAKVSMDACLGTANKRKLHKFLVDWLVHHILVDDMAYKPYLKSVTYNVSDFC